MNSCHVCDRDFYKDNDLKFRCSDCDQEVHGGCYNMGHDECKLCAQGTDDLFKELLNKRYLSETACKMLEYIVKKHTKIEQITEG